MSNKDKYMSISATERSKVCSGHENPFVDSIIDSMAFRFIVGGRSRLLGKYTSGWRCMPYTLLACIRNGDLRVDFRDAQVAYVGDDQFLCIPAGCDHCITKTSPGEAVSTWVHVNFKVLNSIDLFSLVAPPFIIARDEAQDVYRAVDRLLTISGDDDGGFARRLEARTQMSAIVAALLRFLPEESLKSLQTGDLYRSAPALDIIRRQFGTDLTVAQMANTANLSERRFRYVFQNAVGTAPADYLRAYRVRHAQDLLITTELPVGEISRQCGFSDQFHFSKVFKRLCGKAPRDYRDQNRPNNSKPMGF